MIFILLFSYIWLCQEKNPVNSVDSFLISSKQIIWFDIYGSYGNQIFFNVQWADNLNQTVWVIWYQHGYFATTDNDTAYLLFMFYSNMLLVFIDIDTLTNTANFSNYHRRLPKIVYYIEQQFAWTSSGIPTTLSQLPSNVYFI